MAWRLFQWGSRGPYYDTGLGVFVAHLFIPRCVQITLFGRDERSDELLHTFHAATVGALPTQGDCDAIAAAVKTWAINPTTGLEPIIHLNVVIERVIAQSIAEFEGPYAEELINEAGLRRDTPNPSLLTLNMKKATGQSGRTHRGYFATWPACVTDIDTTDQNLWGGGYVAECVANYGALVSVLDTAGYPMVVASRARQDITPVTNITYTTTAIRNRHSRAAGIGR